MRKRVSFKAPITVWLDPAHRNFGTHMITNVQDGLSALNRFGLDRIRHHARWRDLWADADRALRLAVEEPNGANIRTARKALVELAEVSGALVVPQARGARWLDPWLSWASAAPR